MLPLCRRKNQTCPIIDVAPLITINKRVNYFQSYKVLAETNTPESILIDLLKKAGLDSDINTLIEAEVIYSKMRKKSLDKQNRKRK